jgi:hypothetical protein
MTCIGMTARGVSVQFVKENLTFTGQDSPMANPAAECDGCVRAVRGGIAIAKRAGAYRGRKRVLSEERGAELTRRASRLAKTGPLWQRSSR